MQFPSHEVSQTICPGLWTVYKPLGRCLGWWCVGLVGVCVCVYACVRNCVCARTHTGLLSCNGFFVCVFVCLCAGGRGRTGVYACVHVCVCAYIVHAALGPAKHERLRERTYSEPKRIQQYCTQQLSFTTFLTRHYDVTGCVLQTSVYTSQTRLDLGQKITVQLRDSKLLVSGYQAGRGGKLVSCSPDAKREGRKKQQLPKIEDI